MSALVSFFVIFLRLAKKFVWYVLGIAILSVLIGSTLFIVLCSARGMCMGAVSWVALEVILFFFGLVVGTYEFVKIK